MIKIEGTKEIIKSNGVKCTVRDNRDRFFFPDEWDRFHNCLTEKTKLPFEILICTGARHNEAHNIKVGDIDLQSGRLTLRVTKIKAKKGEKHPRPRIISISAQLCKKIKKHIRSNNLNSDDYIGVPSRASMHTVLKNNLQKAQIKDWYMISLHNIRKTHGNYLKALGIEGAEICTRLGHDYNTFLRSYSSPDIFTSDDRRKMIRIIGDIYQNAVKGLNI